MKSFKIFEIEKKSRKGLLPIEWIILGYLVLTLLLALFMTTKIHDIGPLIWERFRFVMMMLGLWVVYRLIPCRLTMFFRIALQLLFLGIWYPETFEFNRHFPNLDHLFATYEQSLCGCQPALLFSQASAHPVFSELMHLGYSSYFPLIALITLFYFFRRYDQFLQAEFILLGAFFIYYVIFIFLPVTGPQYYYLAAGFDQIAKGVFPDMGNYFATHMEKATTPGWSDGFFYSLVEGMHEAGERPTAAFPSSHVGITTILMFLAWRTRCKPLFWGIMPFYVLMCFATVYIQAHYVIDVIGGWISAIVFYIVLLFVSKKFV